MKKTVSNFSSSGVPKLGSPPLTSAQRRAEIASPQDPPTSLSENETSALRPSQSKETLDPLPDPPRFQPTVQQLAVFVVGLVCIVLAVGVIFALAADTKEASAQIPLLVGAIGAALAGLATLVFGWPKK